MDNYEVSGYNLHTSQIAAIEKLARKLKKSKSKLARTIFFLGLEHFKDLSIEEQRELIKE